MSEGIHIGAAANTLAPALAELRRMGFVVTRHESHDPPYRATRSDFSVSAEDTIQLLGLAILVERRGPAATAPTDSEISDLLLLDSPV
jgi:hypothetical protein